MILVQPEVIDHHENPPVPSLLQHIQEGSDADEDGETLVLDYTFPIFIFDVEFSTFHTVGFRLVASPASPVAILLANSIANEDIFDAVSGVSHTPHPF